MDKIIERTEISQEKKSSGLKSLDKFIDRESERLETERAEINLKLSNTRDRFERLDLNDALIKNSRDHRNNNKLRDKSNSLHREKTDSKKFKESAVQRRLFNPASSVTSNSCFQTKVHRAQNEGITLVGYPAVFNLPSVDIGWIEFLAPGCFSEALKDPELDACALFNHQSDYLLGRTANGTLRLYETEYGLQSFVDLIPNDGLSDAIAQRVHRGDISGQSFCFTVAEDNWVYNEDGSTHRTIIKIDKLYDVGPVTYPAYPDTTISIDTRSDAQSSESVYYGNDPRFERGYAKAGKQIANFNLQKNNMTKAHEQGYAKAGERIARLNRKINSAKKETDRKYKAAGRLINRMRQYQVA